MQVSVLKSCFKGQKMDLRKILLEHGICGSFFLRHLTFIILNKKDVIWWHFDDDLRVRGQEPEDKFHIWDFDFFLFKKVNFYRFKKSINNNSTIFKGFFLSGSIKTFNSFEDFFFNVQFWLFVSEIWFEDFLKMQNKSSII